MHRHSKEAEGLRHELTHPIHSSVPYPGFFLVRWTRSQGTVKVLVQAGPDQA